MTYTNEILKIATFMGITYIQGVNEHTGGVYYYYDNPVLECYDGLPFYDNWNDLMPVVIKIESMGGDHNEFDIFGNCVQLGDEKFVGQTKIEAVRNAVIWWIRNNHLSEID